MPLSFPYRLLLIVGASAQCVACGASDSPASQSDSGTVDVATVDAATTADSQDTGPSGWTVGVYHTLAVPPGPVAGAVVILEQNDTRLAQTTSDSDGTATLPSPDWSQGAVTLTVSPPPGHVYRSMVGITPQTLQAYRANLSPAQATMPQDAPVFLSSTSDSDRFATLSGHLPSLDAGHFVLVTPTVPGTFYQNAGAQYSLRVLKGSEFSLLTLEVESQAAGPRSIAQDIHHFWQVDHGGVQADAKVDLDTGVHELTPQPLAFDLDIPQGDDGPLGTNSTGYFWVTSAESAANAFFGAATRCGPSADATRFECEGKYVAPDGLTPSYLVTATIMLADGSEARVAESPIPPSGTKLTGFQPPIPITVANQKLADPISLTGVAPGTALVSWTLQGENARWQIVSLDTSATSLKAPQPPEDLLNALGSEISARLQCYGPTHPSLGYRRWITSSRSFAIIR